MIKVLNRTSWINYPRLIINRFNRIFKAPYGISWLDYLHLILSGNFLKKCHVRGLIIHVKARSALEVWRCKTYETKEPETLDWIDGFAKGDVLFDIGANIGIYSLYAGKRGHRVYSFEPESQNYSGLAMNCMANKLTNVTPYCLALADREYFDLLYVTSTNPGDSQHNLGEENPFFERECSGTQGIFACSLDKLCFEYGFPIPQHIKIDVDGLEEKIIEGAKQVLSHPDFGSLLIEIAGYDGVQPDTISRLATFGLVPISMHAREYRSGTLWARNQIFIREKN
jgi:FkbM family methyltransferase